MIRLIRIREHDKAEHVVTIGDILDAAQHVAWCATDNLHMARVPARNEAAAAYSAFENNETYRLANTKGAYLFTAVEVDPNPTPAAT